MIVIHFMSRKQLDDLFHIFARPVPHHNEIDWIAPAWWYMAYATARS
jgi:hypothetical protein